MKIKSCYWKKSGIYEIINIYNFKRYIGSSKDVYHRLHKHLGQLKRKQHFNSYLQEAWNENSEAFRCFMIEECSQEDIPKREQYWITKLHAEYNINRDIYPSYIPSEEVKKKISEYSKQMWKDKKFTNVYTKIKVYKLVEEYVGEFDSLKEASQILDVKYRSIQQSLSGNHKKHNREHQYIFKYYSK
ncbi:MAG: GIY-YIG nuclease family protein [Methanogenium sp.]|jgi:hypothetical protein